MRKTLFLVIATVFAISSFAKKGELIRNPKPIAPQTRAITDNSFVFGYSTDNIDSDLGYAPNVTVRMAFLIPKEIASRFTGAQITKIHVGFGSSPATNTSVFIAEGLSSTTAYTQPATFNTLTWNDITLSTPYTITGTTDVLVGYEFTGGGAGEFFSIGFDDSIDPNMNGNYFSELENGSYSQWDSFANHGYFNLTLKATIQGNNLPQHELSVNSLGLSSYDVFPNEIFSIRTSVTNQATQTITSIKLAYKVGETTTEDVVSGISIAPLKNYIVSKDLSLPNEGVYPVEVTVLELNGEEDENISNNRLSANQTVWVGNSVPTISRKRNVVLEEYTGINCAFCSDGHKRANQLSLSYSGQFEIINIHQGAYATPAAGEPDFRTDWGNALADQSGLDGYPSGTVNRHVFGNNKTALYRDAWENAAKQIITEPSPVNVRATTYIDWTANTLTVDVTGYYTANSNAATNLLNVALLQENILGPQVSADFFYPEMINSAGLYTHNHMLRHLLTGQWGDTIYQTTANSTFTKHYTYKIPEDYNGINVSLNNLTILVYIAEGKQEIITGAESKMNHDYIASPNIKVMKLEQVFTQTIDNNILVKVIVQNNSQATVASYDLQYKVNEGEFETYSVTGKNLRFLEQDTLTLPLIPIILKQENTVTVSVKQTNGETQPQASQASLNVTKELSFADTRSLSLKLWQDQYGSETTWKLLTAEGDIVTSGGPYEDLTGQTKTKLHQHNLTVPKNGLYRFEIYDTYSDGINNGAESGEGKYEIWAGNTLLTSSDGKFEEIEIKLISVEDVMSINDISASNIYIYNFEDNLYINSSSKIAYVAVYDVFGKQLILQNKFRDFISLKKLTKGIYIVKVVTQTGEKKVAKVIK